MESLNHLQDLKNKDHSPSNKWVDNSIAEVQSSMDFIFEMMDKINNQ